MVRGRKTTKTGITRHTVMCGICSKQFVAYSNVVDKLMDMHIRQSHNLTTKDLTLINSQSSELRNGESTGNINNNAQNRNVLTEQFQQLQNYYNHPE